MKARLLAILVVIAPWLLLFAPMLFRNECFTLRDAGYYYYPMYQWNAEQWQQGNVPSWNPLENIGTPVVGDATAAVFYPLQIVFHIPWLGFATKFVLYTVLHVLVAAAGSYWLCRKLGTTRLAATLGAIAFAFGGSVLFQHCNVIFLVGAAWLPWVMATGFNAIKQRCFRSAASCSLCMALMILGGDPQAAYHAGLALALLAVIARRIEKRAAIDDSSETNGTASTGCTKNRFVILSVIALFAAMFSAVQILPSIEWSSRSQRKTYIAPRTIYEVPGYLERESNVGWYGVNFGLTGSQLPGTHHHHVYQFSNPPWVFTELFFPNVGGKMDSVNRRWSHSLPGVDRMWTPSIYLGLLPAMLALSLFSLRSQNVGVRWMSWLAMLFAVGSLGWYGLGWIVHEIAYSMFGVTPDKIPVGAGTGGLYWFMVKVLPGYVYFRYPAKLFVVAALGISTLAAFGFDRLSAAPNLRMRVLKFGLPIISLAGLLGVSLFGGTLMRSSAATRADFFFGPLDVLLASGDLRSAFLQTFLVSSAVLLLLHFKRRNVGNHENRFAAGLLLLTVIELLIANHSMIETGPASLWTESHWTASRIHQESQPTAATIPPRIFRGQIWLPEIWSTQSSPHRLEDSIRFNRETLFPKHQLQEDIGVVESFTSIAPYDYGAYMTVARTGGFMRTDSLIEPNRELLEVLSAEQLLLPSIPGSEESGGGTNFILARIDSPYPRCWLTTDYDILPTLDSSDPDLVGQRTREVLLTNGNVRDFRRTSVIETNDDIDWTVARPNSDSEYNCEIIEYSPTSIVIRTKTQSQAVLVVNDYYDDGWKASISSDESSTTNPAKIHRTNRVMRGIMIPAGNNRVTLDYQPRSFRTGLWVSIIASLLAGLMIGADSIRSARRSRDR